MENSDPKRLDVILFAGDTISKGAPVKIDTTNGYAYPCPPEEALALSREPAEKGARFWATIYGPVGDLL